MNYSLYVILSLSLLLQACASAKKVHSDQPIKASDIPSVTKPKVNCSLVPDTIDGNKWIEKHRVCIIDSPSTWSR